VRQFARAEALLKEIIKDYPRFPLADFNLGLLYDEQGRLEEAKDAYTAEVAAYPSHFKARFNLGKVLFQLGDDAAALEEMREVVKISPQLPQGYLFQARGLLKQGAPLDEVQALVEKGLSLAESPDMKAWLPAARDVYNRKQQPEK
jgi:tetratricopeptide (TPR) repeat protein